MNWPASVARAVAAVRDSIEAVVKKKSAAGGVNYAFQHWDDVVLCLRAACKDAGLIISPNIAGSTMEYQPTRSGGQAACWLVALDIDLVAVEDGACHRCRWEGEANDSGDKGEQKAATSAYKYWALKTFQIPTEDDSTDNDHVQAEPLAHRQKPATRSTEPQPAAQPQKAHDPLKTAKLAVKAAAQEAGFTGKEVWGFFADGKDEAGQVMRWAEFCANEGGAEQAAAAVVRLYLNDQDDPFTETPTQMGLDGLTGGAN